MTRIAIIGGGISGLAAAFTLEEHRRKSGANLEYTLYESSRRLGGVLQTERIDGCVVEAGPDSFLTEKPWAAELCRAIGIGDQLIGSNDHERKTYILVRGRLVEIPHGLMFMVPTKILPTVLSPLFSWKTKLRMAREFLAPPYPVKTDESVASFVERHYGAEMIDRLADPLLSGIYGGGAANLSVCAVLPRFAEMEGFHGSLGRAMLAARRKAPIGGSPRPIFTSLKNGMQQLVDALVPRLSSSSLRTSVPVRAIQREGNRWIVATETQSDDFDAVIVATPAPIAGRLLANYASELAAELDAISYTSSITIALGFHGEVRRELPPGFGFLVPHSEGRRMLAATFVHNKFSHRVPADRAQLRCFIAGKNADEVWSFSDEKIIAVVSKELREILGIRVQPLFARVYRWTSAMAQYGVGHLERLEKIEGLRRQLPGLALAGNGYRGIGIPDCIRMGRDAAKEVASF